MRNLKKVLSLALALVMLLGMMVVGAGAATDFKDADEIENTEAVDVVSGIGVLQGDENGNFNPEGTLSRAEAAVVIAKLDLGAAFGNLATTNASTFSDVPNGYWGKPYIDYCAARGLIAGDGAGHFNPDGKVTGVQFGLMVARVLGYEDKAEQVGGSDWEVKAAALARKAGLTDGVTLGSQAMTRDEMAQVAYNALKANMVYYSIPGTEVNTGNGSVIIGGTPAAPQGSNGNIYNGVNDGYRQLCEEKFPNLKLTSDTDGLERPSNKWTYNRATIATTVNEATAEWTTAISRVSTMTSALNVSSSINTEVWVDGVERPSLNTLQKFVDAKLTGKGVLTQAWYVAANGGTPEKVKVTVVNYYLAETSEDYDATNKDINLTIYNSVGSLVVKNSDIEVSDLKKGDFLVVTVNMTATEEYVVTLAPAKTIENVAVTNARNGDYVTAGDKYSYNDVAKATSSGALGQSFMATASSYDMVNSTYNLYLDPYDYVLGVKGYESAVNVGNYLFLTAVDTTTNFTRQAKVVFSDGTSGIITVAKINNNDVNNLNFTASQADHFYRFTTDEKGVYSLTSISNVTGVNESNTTDKDLAPKANPIESNTAQFADASTVFVAKDKAYTGVANAPTITSVTDDNNPANGVEPQNDVYFLYDSSNRLILVYATQAGIVNVDAKDLTYILDKKPQVNNAGGTEYYVYQAFVNGEVVEVEANDNNKSAGLYKITSKTNDRANLGTPITTTANEFIAVPNVTGYAYSEPTLTIKGDAPDAGSYVLDEDAQVYTIDGTTARTISPNTLSDRTATTGGFKNAILVKASTAANAKIVAVYLVKTSGVKAVATADDATVDGDISTTPATTTVAGVAVDLSGKTEDNKMAAVKAALDTNTLGTGASGWVFTVESDGSIKATAKKAGIVGTTTGAPAAALADFTAGVTGVAPTKATISGTISIKTTAESGGANGGKYEASLGAAKAYVTAANSYAEAYAALVTVPAGYTISSAPLTDGGSSGAFTLTANDAGAKTNTNPLAGASFNNGSDGTKATATLAKSEVLLSAADTLTFDSKTYTVTGAGLDAKMKSWAAAYNADADNSVWTASVDSAAAKFVFTAKTAGSAANASKPTGTSLTTSGADW